MDMNLFLDVKNPRFQAFHQAFLQLVIFVFCVLLIWQGTKFCMLNGMQTAPTTGMPMIYVYSAMAIGGRTGVRMSTNATEAQQRAISVHLARISLKILTHTKLARIDKDRHHHVHSLRLGCSDQRQMAIVQRAHGRHQCQDTVLLQRLDSTAQWIKLPNDLHAAYPLDKTALAESTRPH